MTSSIDWDQVPHPPAPWRSRGKLWAGIFDTGQRIELPHGLKPALGSTRVVVIIVRYLQGTLRYDELAVGPIARRGLRFGIHIDYIWVDSQASVAGGRRIWGLPKELATFEWKGDTVHVSDDKGLIAAITVNRTPSSLPAINAVAPGFGHLDGSLVYTKGKLRGSIGKSGMRVEAWSNRFPYRIAGEPFAGASANPMEIEVPAPARL